MRSVLVQALRHPHRHGPAVGGRHEAGDGRVVLRVVAEVRIDHALPLELGQGAVRIQQDLAALIVGAVEVLQAEYQIAPHLFVAQDQL